MFFPEWYDKLLGLISNTRKITIRVDAGRIPGLSFGHLERCLLLSKLLCESGIYTQFFMRDYPEGIARAKSCGANVHIIQQEEDWADSFFCADMHIIDLPYPPEDHILHTINQHHERVLFIDDTGRDLFASRIVLNYSVLAEKSMYPRAHHHLLGPEYLMVDREFTKLQASIPSHKNSILVTMGGSDPTNLTEKIAKKLMDHNLQNIRITFVTGPGYNKHAYSRLKRIVGSRACLLSSPDELLPLVADSHAVICNGGKTLYECFALKKKILAVASTEHEGRIVNALMKRGDLVDTVEEWSQNRFSIALEKLIQVITNDRTE